MECQRAVSAKAVVCRSHDMRAPFSHGAAFQPNGGPPPSASDVRPGGKVLVPGKGMVDLPVPR